MKLCPVIIIQISEILLNFPPSRYFQSSTDSQAKPPWHLTVQERREEEGGEDGKMKGRREGNRKRGAFPPDIFWRYFSAVLG